MQDAELIARDRHRIAKAIQQKLSEVRELTNKLIGAPKSRNNITKLGYMTEDLEVTARLIADDYPEP